MDLRHAILGGVHRSVVSVLGEAGGPERVGREISKWSWKMPEGRNGIPTLG